MDIESIKEAVSSANEVITSSEEKIKSMRSMIAGLQSLCPHAWVYDGEGYHGSSKGDEYYHCSACGLKETR